MTNVAAKMRQQKDAHPELFCRNSRCLWKIVTAKGSKPCQNHPVAIPAPVEAEQHVPEGR